MAYWYNISMQVRILDIPKDLNVITVTLTNDRLDPTKLSMFHCSNCGERVIQFMGNVVRIIPGGLPINILESSAHIIAHCLRCKTKYLFTGIS